MAQRVTQNATDNASLQPMLDEVDAPQQRLPTAASLNRQPKQMEERNIDAAVPDSNPLTWALPAPRSTPHAYHRQSGWTSAYARRKAIVPVFGVLRTTTRYTPVSHADCISGCKRIHPDTGLQHHPTARPARSLKTNHLLRCGKLKLAPAAAQA